jgi:RES domain-containing protein
LPTIWRLIKTKRAATAFDGEGAKLYGARWNSPGVRVAYGSGSVALAVLEVLVHLQASQFLPSYSLCSAIIPDDLVETLPTASLPANWKHSPAPAETAAIGDSWIASGSRAVLSVPSVIVESEPNYLLNPAHTDFARITIRAPVAFEFDPRLR